MFFIMNAFWIALLLIGIGLMAKGSMLLGVVFIALGLLELGLVGFFYRRKNPNSCDTFDCLMLECGLEALPDCLDCGTLDCL